MKKRIYSTVFFLFFVLYTNLLAQKVFTYSDLMNDPAFNEKPDFSKKNPSIMTFDSDSAILPYLFYWGAIPNQIDTPVTTLDALGQRLQKFDISTSDLFTSYANMNIVNDTLIDTIFRVDFQLNSKMYKSYSYFVPGQISADSVAFMIIPGSGYNQSTAIYNNNLSDYHGNISARVSKYGDTYIFTKPMYDFLGIHRNNTLLTHDAFTAHLINNGYSWGAYYLTQAIALSKHLKNKYKKFIILGLSQGGWATTYVSLQVEPTAAIAASGYTILITKVAWMGINQLIGHNIFTTYTNQFIYNTIQTQSTKYLFSYGKSDNGGYFKSEAENLYTCNYFSPLPNVFCGIGNWGHQFGDTLTTELFIEDIIRPVPVLNNVSDSVIVCPGDSLILSVNNEPGNIFQWYKNSSPIIGATNDSLIITSIGNYRVNVSTTSNVDSISKTITVLMDTNRASIIITSSNPFCDGDTLLFVNTFPNPYSSLQWYLNDSLLTSNNNSDTLLVTGNGSYHIVINDTNGCQKTSLKDTIQFINIGIPVLSSTASGHLCSGDSSWLIYNNTNSFFTGWFRNDTLIPSFNNKDSLLILTSGVYHIITTDTNGCSKPSLKDTVSFLSLQVPVLVPSSDTSTLCEGDSAFLIYNNTGNYFTQWFRNDTLIPSGINKDSLLINSDGTYHLVISDTNGCIATSQYYPINIKDTIKPLIFIDGDTLGINPVGTSYQWFFQGGILFGETSNEHVADTTGNYFVQVILPNGCTVYSDTVNVMVTSVPDPQSGNLFNAVFNPGNQTLDVSFNNSVSGEINLKVVDTYGNVVKEFKIIKSSVYFSKSFNMSDVASGMYVVSIQSKENFIHTKTIKSPR